MFTPQALPSPKWPVIVSGRKYRRTARSVKPRRFRSRTMCSMMGTLPTGTRGFGKCAVRGLRRVPNPPAMTTAFISRSPRSQTGAPRTHRAYRSIAERIARRNLPEALVAFRGRLAGPEQKDERHSGQEASQMGKPRDLPAIGPSRPCHQTAHELDEEPKPQNEDGRDPDQAYEEAHDDEGENIGPGEKKEIGAENSRHRPACSDHGNRRACTERHLCHGRDHAGDQEEDQEPAMSQRIFDVVAEDPQVEHVPTEVQEAAVQEHRGHDGEGR